MNGGLKSGDNQQPPIFDFCHDNQILLTRRNLELQQQLQHQQQQSQHQLEPLRQSGFRAEPLIEIADLSWWGLSRGASKTYEILGPGPETGFTVGEVSGFIEWIYRVDKHRSHGLTLNQ